ncbi:hypothetical protein [Mucilaginibacter sp.]|uniref:hypothetical protein n=1 Tax=Mucilaginibacter sp. TaxID=1882438 RepID=UPI0025EB53CC|nr:hypothetical protein [Mucilaginibacter sp.]
MLKTVIIEKKMKSSFMNFCLGNPRGVKNMIIHNIPAKKVMIVVPGIEGIIKKEITGKTSINKLT